MWLILHQRLKSIPDKQPEKDGSLVFDGNISTGKDLTYRWSTSGGKIIGPDDKPLVKLFGKGQYSLEVTDAFGCKSVKDFSFPIELYQVEANPDYARTSWAEDTTIFVLNNDHATAPLNPQSIKITKPATFGETKINPDGSILYTPKQRKTGRDQFTYEVCDILQTCNAAIVTIEVKDPDVRLIQGFSPNGDGVNDFLLFNGLGYYPQTVLYVYNRSGQLVFHSNDYKNEWDGTSIQSTIGSRNRVPTGVYYYVLELGGTLRKIKGFFYIGY